LQNPDQNSHVSEKPLEQYFKEIVEELSRTSGTTLDALIARLGLGGSPPITLQAAGDIASLTRERMRQIESKFRSRSPVHPIHIPGLADLIDAIGQNVPMSVEQTSRMSITHGIATIELHPESIKAMADFTGDVISGWEVVSIGSKKRVLRKPSIDVKSVVSAGKSLCSTMGIAEGDQLFDELCVEDASLKEEIKDILFFLGGLIPLDGPWFFDPNASRNRITKIARKILSVGDAVYLEDIAEGISRESDRRNKSGITTRNRKLTTPPIPVLESFFSIHPDFSVSDNGMLYSLVALDWHSELGQTERTFTEVIRSFPSGVVERATLQDRCQSAGMKESTFNSYTSYSPIIKHVAMDIWGLMGTEFNAVEIQALKATNSARSRSKRVKKTYWTKDGNLCIETWIPKNFGNFVFLIPSGFQKFFLYPKFAAVDSSGESYLNVGVTKKYMCHGFANFLRRNGAKEGDLLKVEFNLPKRMACLQLEQMESVKGDPVSSSRDLVRMDSTSTDPVEAGKAVSGSLLESEGFKLGEPESTAYVMACLQDLGVITLPDSRPSDPGITEDWYIDFWCQLDDLSDDSAGVSEIRDF